MVSLVLFAACDARVVHGNVKSHCCRGHFLHARESKKFSYEIGNEPRSLMHHCKDCDEKEAHIIRLYQKLVSALKRNAYSRSYRMNIHLLLKQHIW